MSTIKCKECGNQISKKATACPSCGAPPKKKISFKVWLIVAFVSIIMINSIVQDGRDAEVEKQAHQTAIDNAEYFQSNKDKILASTATLLKKGKYKEVMATAKKYILSKNKKLAQFSASAETAIILKELKTIPAVMYTKNKEKYDRLLALNPTVKQYEEKSNFYNKKIKREKEISVGFSEWDGSHAALEAYIKRNMKDPSSYEHVETRYIDKVSYLIVTTTYRGKNSFGAVVINSVKATAKLNGALMEVL